jgi:hypothetical protein
MSRKKGLSKRQLEEKAQFDRRQLLKIFGGSAVSVAYALTPAGQFFNAFVNALIGNAHAAVTGNVKNHIAIIGGGAPPQWNIIPPMLRPEDGFVLNNSVVNGMTDNVYTGVGGGYSKGTPGNAINNQKTRFLVEKVQLMKNGVPYEVYLPALWAQGIPTAEGSWKQMSDLLQNALMIRAVHMEVDIGHQAGPQRAIQPDLKLPSLSGIVADEAGKLLSNVTLASKHNGFKAPSGTSEIILGTGSYANGGPLEHLLSPFTAVSGEAASSATERDMMDELVKKALEELSAYTKARKPGSEILLKNYKNAEVVLKKNFGNYKDEYQTLYDKYEQISSACYTPIENISLQQKEILPIDPVTGLPDDPSQTYSLLASSVVSGGSNAYAVDGALTEFLIKHNLTASIYTTMKGPSTGVVSIISDEHSMTNRQGSAAVFNLRYRLAMAYVNELKNVLTKYDQWENTVIQLGSEYGRCPHNTALDDKGGGSDHSVSAGWCLAFSGDIKEPIFIGNARVNATTSTANAYMGSYATSQETRFKGSDEKIRITTKHMVGAIASILGVKNPIPRIPEIITHNGTTWESLMEEPKNED